jgi:hypothetical protein
MVYKCLWLFKTFIVDLLQWNVDVFHMWLPNTQVVTQYRDPAVIHLKETQLFLSFFKPPWLFSPPS